MSDWLHSTPSTALFCFFFLPRYLQLVNSTGQLGLDFFDTLLFMWAFWLDKSGDKYSCSHLKGCRHRFSTWWGRKIFVPSETLKGSHGVDNTLCFKYLLFRNAIQTQFGTLTLGLTEPPMEDLLSYPVLN